MVTAFPVPPAVITFVVYSFFVAPDAVVDVVRSVFAVPSIGFAFGYLYSTASRLPARVREACSS